jgi:uncharacterized protein (TIGR02246 family)
MTASDESVIQELMDDLTAAWIRGDAKAYGARFRDDATFTNVNGTYHVGREEFDRRHDEVFRGHFKGTTLSMTIKNLRFVVPHAATVDIETTIAGCQAKLPGAVVGEDGALHSRLLMVLVKDGGVWWISAYHNVWRATGR